VSPEVLGCSRRFGRTMTMQYPGGDRIELGDTVLLEGQARGTVVGLIDEGAYSPPYLASEWDYLGAGVLIEADDAGLTHYNGPDEAWKLLSRGGCTDQPARRTSGR